MPGQYSDNPFDTIPTDPNAMPSGPLRGASDFVNALTAPPESTAEGRLRRAGIAVSGSTRPWSVSSGWQGRLLNGARSNQGMAASPYDENYANQSRAAQMALMQQMRGQMNGPSIAAMQGQRAMGQSGQQALGAAAMGAPGRAAMMQAGQVAGGMAGDIGQARLAEVMRAQAGMGGLAGSIRGADQQSALGGAAAQLEAQRNRDNMFRFYAGLGSNASLDDLNYQLDQQKLSQRVLGGAKAETNKAWEDAANAVASMFGMVAKGG